MVRCVKRDSELVHLDARRYGVPRVESSRTAGLLRQAREQRALTIEQAAAGAGVPLRYARLLEADPGAGVGIADELYLVPFFRRYATFVGLNAEQLLPDFLGQVQEVPSGAAPSSSFSYTSRASSVRKLLAAGAAVAAAVLLIMRQAPRQSPILDEPWQEPVARETSDGAAAPQADIAAASASGERALSDAAPAPAVPAEKPSPAQPGSDAASPPANAGVATAGDDRAAAVNAPAGANATAGEERAADASAPAGANTIATEARPAGLRELRIVAAEETWFSLAIDGADKREFILRPGESRTWSGHESFTLTVGNAGGITLTLDGRELPPLGVSGQVVRNLRLPADGA